MKIENESSYGFLDQPHSIFLIHFPLLYFIHCFYIRKKTQHQRETISGSSSWRVIFFNDLEKCLSCLWRTCREFPSLFFNVSEHKQCFSQSRGKASIRIKFIIDTGVIKCHWLCLTSRLLSSFSHLSPPEFHSRGILHLCTRRFDVNTLPLMQSLYVSALFTLVCLLSPDFILI